MLKGTKHSPETREKLRAVWTPERREKMRVTMLLLMREGIGK